MQVRRDAINATIASYLNSSKNENVVTLMKVFVLQNRSGFLSQASPIQERAKHSWVAAQLGIYIEHCPTG